MKKKNFNMSEIQTQLDAMALRSLMSYQNAKGIGGTINYDDADKRSSAVVQIVEGQKREAERSEQMAYDVQKILLLLNQLSVQMEEIMESTEKQEKMLSATDKKLKKVKEKVKKQEKQQCEQKKNILELLKEQQSHKKDLKAVKGCFSVIGVMMGGKYGTSLKSIKNTLEQRLSLSLQKKCKQIPLLQCEDMEIWSKGEKLH